MQQQLGRPQYPPNGAPAPGQPSVPTRQVNMRPNPGSVTARPPPPGYGPPPRQNGHSAAPGAPQQPHYPAPHHPEQEQRPEPKLSSSMMPRPPALEKPCGSPREFYHRGMSAGLQASGANIPSCPTTNTDYVAVDDGSARLRFMRMTTGAIASDPSVMAKSGVPLAVVMTPFADTVPGESPVPVVDYTAAQIGGPLRCERCNGYANPGFKFMSGGSQFQCNLCTHINTTPTEHFSPISPATGQRMDADARHELRFGSVDYLVGSPDYRIRDPTPASYIFAVDVSGGAIASGLSLAAMMSIKSAIGAGLLPGSDAGARVAVMTFDRALHFYDARGSEEGRSVSMQYVPDVNDPFVPIGGDALFLTPDQAVMAVDAAIEIHGLGANAQSQQTAGVASGTGLNQQCALGSALQAIRAALADVGGKAFVVAGSMPTVGLGKLERRGGGAVGGGEEREMSLLREASPDYEILGCELAEVQASVDIFLAPSSMYMDAATLARVPRACGGRLYLFPGFDPVRDGASLHRSLCASAGSVRAFEALMRVRTSPGLEAGGEFIGHFGRPQRGDDVSGPVFDASSSTALEISVSSKLLSAEGSDGGMNRAYAGTASLYEDACVQCAVLFTDSAGRRRIRVHTVFATKTTVLADVFRHADVDATVAFFAKKAASAVLGGTPFSKACEALTEKTAQALYVYRKHCTQTSMSGQLILPEALKVLPVMVLGLIKSSAFRPSAISMQASDAVTVDERAAALSFLVNTTPTNIAAMGYPRMWELQKLDDAAGIATPASAAPVVSNGVTNGSASGKVVEPIALPNTLPLSSESLSDERILLIENGMQMVVWVGDKVSRTAAEDVIVQIAGGRLAIRAETAGSAELTKTLSPTGKRVAAIVQRIVSQRSSLSRPQVVLRSSPGAGGEAKFVMPLLVEDRASNGTHSYVEYLRHVHKRVMDKLANESAQNDMQTWEMLNHGY